ncbi:MAG: sigma-70 family RNA polymerase sigma factor [Steroidobacteraceae bacterium]
MGTLTDIEADPALLRRAAGGEAAAQELLYRLLAGPAFSLTRRLCSDCATAEDLFQDGLMQVFASLDQFRGEAPFGAWVRQILIRRCLMHLRSPWQRARHAWSSDDLAGSVAPISGESIDVTRAFARLGVETRAVLWLYDVEGLTHDEIGAAMGRTASFSKSQLARGHAKLRQWLQVEEPACAPQPSPTP